jgi:hypothetical protein
LTGNARRAEVRLSLFERRTVAQRALEKPTQLLAADDFIHDRATDADAVSVALPAPISGGRSLLVVRPVRMCRCLGPARSRLRYGSRTARDPFRRLDRADAICEVAL